MPREDLASALVRKLEQEEVPKKGLGGRTDDDIVIESAIETLKSISGTIVSKDDARRALDSIKQERYDASLPGTTKKYFEIIAPRARALGKLALTVGKRALIGTTVVAAVSGIGYGVVKPLHSALSRPEPSDFVAGTVVEVHGNSRGDYTLKVNSSKGIYEVDFYRPQNLVEREKREKLVQIIKKGTLVNFPTKNLSTNRFFEQGKFYGKFGVIHTEDIAVSY